MTTYSSDRLLQAQSYLIQKLGNELGTKAYEIGFHVNSRFDWGNSKNANTARDIAGKAVYRRLSDKQINYLTKLVESLEKQEPEPEPNPMVDVIFERNEHGQIELWVAGDRLGYYPDLTTAMVALSDYESTVARLLREQAS